MAKILLVEDDNNLREIYEARLQAEGYTIVSAMDGEEALVVAKKEKPDLVISDVMMPRISGFEMLDILRNTEGLKDVKIIMLTALGQAEDKTRADSLGADRYLVKSQVTLEDIVKAAQELLGPNDATPSAPQATAAAAEQSAALAATAQPSGPTVSTAPPAVTSTSTPAAAAPTVPTASIPVVAPPAADQPEPAATPAATPATDVTDTTSDASTASGDPGTASATLPPSAAPASTPAATQTATPTSATPPTLPTPDVSTAAPAPTVTTTPEPSVEQPPTGVPTPTTPPEPPVATPPAPEPSTPPVVQTDSVGTAETPTAPVTPEPASATPTTPAATDTPSAPELAAPVSVEPTPAPTPVVAPEPTPTPDATTPEPTPALAPEPTTPPANPISAGAQSASAEEAAIKAQIENFVNQNSQTAPKPVGETVMADAIKDLVSDTVKPTPAAPPPKVITPPASGPQNAAPTAPEAPRTPDESESNSVAVAHKKVIKPITNPTEVQPVGLDELLAKEGITNLDEEGHPLAPGTSPTTNPALPAQPTTSGLPTTPHPPGHVISPNSSGTGGVDPNSIAL